MAHLIDKDALVAEINRYKHKADKRLKIKGRTLAEDIKDSALQNLCGNLLHFINTLEVKEVGVWKTIDNINTPQADRNKIYCVFTKDRYILATVINHPKDEDLLQWKCTEFPFHRYDMCEGDKYMQIV